MEITRAYNSQEAAAAIGVAPQTLAKLRMTGGGPRFIKIGRRVAYLMKDIEAWQAAHTHRSTSDCEPTY